MHTLNRITAGLIAAFWLVPSQAQTISRGEVIASTCYTCHGTHGVSPSTIPSIDYIPADRMIETLRAYKSGARYSTIMGRHASAYTDEEIAEAARALVNLQKKGQ